jgi:hypothetical protein
MRAGGVAGDVPHGITTAGRDLTSSARRPPAGGDVQAVPEVDGRDVQHDRAELRLVEVLGGGVPDRVGHLVGPVGETRQRLGEVERGAFGFAEVHGLLVQRSANDISVTR